MKQLFIIAITTLFLTSFTCNKSDNAANNPYNVSSDQSIFFKINISGKSLSTYGIKFGVQAYENLIFNYCRVSINTKTVSGQVESNLDLMVNPIYNIIFGNYGIKDGEVEANLMAYKSGDALGSYTIDNTGFNKIVDKSLANKQYELDFSRSTFSVSSIDSKYIKGSFNLALINGSSVIMSPGTFSLLKF